MRVLQDLARSFRDARLFQPKQTVMLANVIRNREYLEQRVIERNGDLPKGEDSEVVAMIQRSDSTYLCVPVVLDKTGLHSFPEQAYDARFGVASTFTHIKGINFLDRIYEGEFIPASEIDDMNHLCTLQEKTASVGF